MFKKICISGPAASGKTYFIEQIAELQGITVLSESARMVAGMYPDMPGNDIGKFRDKVCELQRQRENIVENLINKGTIVCDRGIFDNLAFLLLQDKNQFNKELSKILGIYKDGIIKPYDYIVYFDVDLLSGITPLLESSLNDALRKATINVDNYARHAADFRNAFIEVTNYFRDIKVMPITAKPDKNGFDERNKFVKDYIFYSIQDKKCERYNLPSAKRTANFAIYPGGKNHGCEKNQFNLPGAVK
ncbi:MAG: AAA family ATPase [bacterium]